ncbi:MAG: hypothetical protein QOG31_1006 [Thermoplasmata archaeon]|jgi:plastocyanin|nr:hypothetical protein [Thermoplasmata archaeon]
MRALLPAALLLALALAGCTGATPGSTSTPTQPLDQGMAPATGTSNGAAPTGGVGVEKTVSISNFKFTPATLSISVGDRVTWTNNDTPDHTATGSGDNAFDSGTIHTGAHFTQPFEKAGTYSYHCAIHASMTGTVIVQ